MNLFLGALLGNCALPSVLALRGHRWSYSKGMDPRTTRLCNMSHDALCGYAECSVTKYRFSSVIATYMWIGTMIEVQRPTQSMTQAIHSLPPVDMQHRHII